MTPSAYYNENNAEAVAWLHELMKRGLIMRGEIDNRSIEDVAPSDLSDFTRCHFFAGLGLWDLALQLAGWPEDRKVWTGSCPCQPFSVAGQGKGSADERHLWPAFRWHIEHCQPTTVFGEQVASKDGRDWLAGVFADLEGMAYHRAGADLCAPGVGAPHIRQRLYWVADSGEGRREVALLDSSSSSRKTFGVGETDVHRNGCEMGNTSGGGFGEFRDEAWSGSCGHIDGAGDAPCGVAQPNVINGHGARSCAGDDSRELRSPDALQGEHDFRRLADTNGRDSGAEREQPGGEQRLLPESGFSDWDEALWHFCRDGKHRRVPVEPLLQHVVDGYSDIMGPRWRQCLEEISNQIGGDESMFREIMRALRNHLQEEAIPQDLGTVECIQKAPLLLFTLLQLAGCEKSEFYVPAPNLIKIQEEAMRAVWVNACLIQTASRPPQERGLDGPPSGESGDTLHRLPSERSASQDEGDVPGVRSSGERTRLVSEALSKVQAAWRSFVDQEESFGDASELRIGEGLICSLTLFPLSPSEGFRVPGMARRRTVRPALLRGSGNGIVPQVAAQFIQAFMETEVKP